MIPYVDVTVLLISSLICFSIGALWFSPALFGKQWFTIIEATHDDYGYYINGRTFSWFALFVVLLNVGMGFVVDSLGYKTMNDGVILGIAMWIVFIIPSVGIHVAVERRSFFLFIIYSGYFLVTFVISAALFAMWR